MVGLVDFLHDPGAVDDMDRNFRVFGESVLLICTLFVADKLIGKEIDTLVVATHG
jgi:hypothetical protein